MQCPKCGGQMRLIPQGVSKKTGKAYEAFYACEDRECNKTLPTKHIPTKPAPKPELKLAPKKDMEEVWEEKDLRMARMCGIKAATEFSKVSQEVKTVEEVIETADRFVNYIYEGKK